MASHDKLLFLSLSLSFFKTYFQNSNNFLSSFWNARQTDTQTHGERNKNGRRWRWSLRQPGGSRDRVFGSALLGQCWMRQREPRLSSHTHSDHVWRVCSDGDDERSSPSSPLLLRLIRNTWSAFWRNRSGFKKQRRKVWKFVCMHASWRVINNKLIPKPSLAYIPSIAAIYLSNWL